jgi:hypothetical protein
VLDGEMAMLAVMVLLHGAAGGLDELAVGVVAFAVLWFAVKLAGRKPAKDEDEQEELAPGEPHAEADAGPSEPTHSTPTKTG